VTCRPDGYDAALGQAVPEVLDSTKCGGMDATHRIPEGRGTRVEFPRPRAERYCEPREGAHPVVVSRRKLGLVATAGVLLAALLIVGCEGPDWMPTNSTATLPASEPSFHRGLSGAGYYTVMVHTVPEGGTKVMEVWVWVDPGKETRATYDVIYDHAVALAKKYGIADSTGGRLRVVLIDAAPGQLICESIIESRDFDLTDGNG
jgi:hypothetical protein